MLIKSAGVIAGITLARHIFSVVDEDLRWEILKEDGEEVQAGGALSLGRHGGQRRMVALSYIFLQGQTNKALDGLWL
ncbi:MAG: hypothetical protein HC913_09795 [Microscillaceae bacterium]|nr:hypothetical protein [Microscillaceae bacterium]